MCVCVCVCVCINRNNRNSSTARQGCERRCNSLTRVIPQTGVTHIIRLIYIHNAAQGDEHDNLPSTESKPCGGEKKQLKKKKKSLDGGGLFETERSVSSETKRRFVGLFAPLLDYDMDALKSAGRAIIRSPSVAKQSWGSGRHKSEYAVVKYTTAKALAGADVSKSKANLAEQASLDKELTLHPAYTHH